MEDILILGYPTSSKSLDHDLGTMLTNRDRDHGGGKGGHYLVHCLIAVDPATAL